MDVEARLRDSYGYPSIRACAGVEFTKSSWTLVSGERVDLAKKHPDLITRPVGSVEEPPTPVIEPSSDSKSQLDEVEEEEGQIDASDTAVAYAEEHGIDLSKVVPARDDGKITLRDVKSFSGG